MIKMFVDSYKYLIRADKVQSTEKTKNLDDMGNVIIGIIIRMNFITTISSFGNDDNDKDRIMKIIPYLITTNLSDSSLFAANVLLSCSAANT